MEWIHYLHILSFISASPDLSNTDIKQTEVFFVANSDTTVPESLTLRDPIVITQNIDASVTSSTMSAGLTGSYSDDDEDSDDFCMIDDTAWAKSVSSLNCYYIVQLNLY